MPNAKINVNVFTYMWAAQHFSAQGGTIDTQQPLTHYSAMNSYPSREAATSAELSNRLFFRLYQCANLMHKTGAKALERYGVTTQQWAVLGALSRQSVAASGMTVNELARFLRVSRQNLAGVINRMEAQGHIERVKDAADLRSRRVRLSEAGWPLWRDAMQPAIDEYYARALADFSINDKMEALHYLNRLFENFKKVDAPDGEDGPGE